MASLPENERSYSINEAAEVTGLHRNTIRQRVRLGTLRAVVTQGKFGEQYSIPHSALVEANLLTPEGNPVEADDFDDLTFPLPRREPPATPRVEAVLANEGETATPKMEAVLADESETATPKVEAVLAEETEAATPHNAPTTVAASSLSTDAALAALGDLYQRHEQAMFRLGYLQGELDRVKELAESAESLQQTRREQEAELLRLRREVEEREQRAAREAAAAAAEQEAWATKLAAEQEAAHQAALEAARLKAALETAQAEAERREAAMRELEARANRPWWRRW